MKENAAVNTVNCGITKRTGRYPATQDTIGADPRMRSYAGYLINRYNFYAAKGKPEGEFIYGLVYGAVEKKFGAKWDAVPAGRFAELF